ncbi:MAG: serine hydrolase [Flavobacteriia bacterium]|nr:serine hydrolase [Flavobacteriia bacterium]
MLNKLKSVIILISLFFVLFVFISFSFKNYNTTKSVFTPPLFLNFQNSWAEKTLQTLSVKEKIAQLMMVATWPNKEEKHQKEIEQLIIENKIGGLIIFQSDSKSQCKKAIQNFQKISKIPLLIGMDAEWGVGMRINEYNRFPYHSTLGLSNDTSLTKKIAESIAFECKELGIHINFAPVADIQSNPQNPVIGFRSFGSNTLLVSQHTSAFVKGLEENGVLSCIKHFPGHGDTDVDSHFDLPQIKRPLDSFSKNEWIPFENGIQSGASSVMMAHLETPLIDESRLPSSLSSIVIKKHLKENLHFKGLIISDALNMKAVSDKYGKTELVVKAFLAGNDILLYPESINESINAIHELIVKGEISEQELNQRCLKVLKAKQFAFFSKINAKNYTPTQIEYNKRQVYENASCLVKNEETLPLQNNLEKTVFVSFGSSSTTFNEMLKNFGSPLHFHFDSIESGLRFLKENERKFDNIITVIHTTSQLKNKNFGLPIEISKWSSNLQSRYKNVLLYFGNSMALNEKDLLPFKAVLLCNENHPIYHDIAIQQLFGAIEVKAKNFVQLADAKLTIHQHYPAINRLKYTLPEELGIPSEALNSIDEIVLSGIKAKAFPGCQVLFAVKGKVIYRKNFGKISYDDTTTVSNQHLYDIASISKIAGSMICLMHMDNQNNFSLEKSLNDYLPEIVAGTTYENLTLKSMLAHQAGLTPWIAFYKSTLENGKYKEGIFSTYNSENYPIQVADNLFISKNYEKKLYNQILETALKPNPKYEYSDLPYYFVKKIIEKNTKMNLDVYLNQHFYKPLGLHYLCYNPLKKFDKKQVTPTENDTIFRKQLIQGFVHDPGAAMLGGVGGHAGLFSNANDLAILMQMLLNKGNYSNKSYLSPAVIQKYTSTQFPGNRRGAGFDKPTLNKIGGTACPLVSEKSYGHSGFTGTLTWVDPFYEVNYVFLSNRVNPDAENRKIQTMNIRTEIQKVMYEAIKKYL